MVGADTSYIIQTPPVMPVLSMHITRNTGESSHTQFGLLRPKREHQMITEIKDSQQRLHHKPQRRVQHRHACEKSTAGDPSSMLPSLH